MFFETHFYFDVSTYSSHMASNTWNPNKYFWLY